MSLFRAKDESEFMFSSSLELLSLSLMFLPDASLAFLDLSISLLLLFLLSSSILTHD